MKTTDGVTTRRLLLALVRGEGQLVAGWLMSLLAASFATLAIPLALRKVIDHGFVVGAATDMAFVGLGGVAFVLALTTSARLFFVSQLGDRVVSNMRKTLFRQLLERDMDFHHAHKSSELMSRLGMDAEYLRTLVGVAFSSALRNVLTLLGTIVMMFVTSPKLALITLVVVPLAVGPIFGANRKQRALVRKTMDQMAKASSVASESLGAVRAVKEYARESHEHARYGREIDLTDALSRRKVMAQSVLAILAVSLVFAAVIAVLWLGAADVRAGHLSPGMLGQFVLYAVLGGMATTELLETWGLLQRSIGAVSRIADIFKFESPVSSGAGWVLNPDVTPEVAFNDVSFAYAGAPEVPVLEGVNFVASPDRCTAIVGPSGSGKSTLFGLLMGLYVPTAGKVLINGVDVRDFNPQDLRDRLAIVSQTPAMFAMTVRENIRYGRLNATDGEVEAAARAAHAEEFILALPSGYDEQLGERGTRLSGGQLQRIAIARAILKDAPVLLLDEAMSSLDAANERAVNSAIRKLMKGRTTLVIAHRLSTIVDADAIVVIAGGQVKATGTHHALMKEGGLYASFARLQNIGMSTDDLNLSVANQ